MPISHSTRSTMRRAFSDLLGTEAANDLLEQFPYTSGQEPVTRHELDQALREHERKLEQRWQDRRSWWLTFGADTWPFFVPAAIFLAFLVGMIVGEHSVSP